MKESISKRLGPIEQDRFTCTINRGSLWAVRGVYLICSAEIISNGNLEKSGLFAQVWKFVATSKWNKPTAQVASVTCMKFMTSSIATTTWNSTTAQVLQLASIEFMASYVAETIRNTIDVPTFPRQVVQSESYVISDTSAWHRHESFKELRRESRWIRLFLGTLWLTHAHYLKNVAASCRQHLSGILSLTQWFDV